MRAMTRSQHSDPVDFLDPDFGAAGEVNLNSLLGAANVEVLAVNSLVLLNDKSIVVAVEIAKDGTVGPGLIKLTTAGTLDDAFGEGGYVDESYARDGFGDAFPVQLALFGDGHFLSFVEYINPKTGEYNLGCTRYGLDGQRDKAFNHDGRVMLGDFPPLPAVAGLPSQERSAAIKQARATHRLSNAGAHRSLAPDSEAKITFNFTHADWIYQRSHSYIVRLNSNGSIDQTFHADGYRDVLYQGVAMDIWGMTPYLTDRWIITGKVAGTGLVARLDANGDLDSTFGTAGFFATAPQPGKPPHSGVDDNPVRGHALRLDNAWITAGDKIIVIGNNQQTSDPAHVAGLIFGLDDTGHPDPQFPPINRMVGQQRVFFWAIGGTPTGGEYWIGGLEQTSGEVFSRQGLLARVTGTGMPIEDFGDKGYWALPQTESIADVVVQNDGNCLVASMDATEAATDKAKVRRFKASRNAPSHP